MIFIKICGIICEFDPFHNGHKYLIDNASTGDAETVIICVMSPDVMQRGTFAYFEKYSRTRAALLCGADIVAELPCSFALCGAERFALGGVSILNAFGNVDELWFGSECGDIQTLGDIAKALCLKETDKIIREELKNGLPYAKARENAVSEQLGKKAAECLREPNNILATEYLKALNKTGSHIQAHTVNRIGTRHHGMPVGEFSSASFLRDNPGKMCGYVPSAAADVFMNAPTLTKSIDTAVLSRLRMMTREDFLNCYDISEGLPDLFRKASASATTLEELYFAVKSKRYAMSRIKRIALSAFLGISYEQKTPPYIHILGATKRGLDCLDRTSLRLPCDTSMKRLSGQNERCLVCARDEDKVTSLYGLFTAPPLCRGSVFVTPPVIV